MLPARRGTAVQQRQQVLVQDLTLLVRQRRNSSYSSAALPLVHFVPELSVTPFQRMSARVLAEHELERATPTSSGRMIS